MGKIQDRKALESRFLRRRQFLLGLGGVTLCLPPLMSMMSRVAAAKPMGPVKRIVCFPTVYGIAPSMFFPPTPPLASQTQVSTPDLPMWTTPLTGAGSSFNLPFTSDASGIALLDTPFQSLLAKMNLYEGLDYAVMDSETIGHTYGPLGANCRSSGSNYSTVHTGSRSIGFGQSIDNLIAKSSNFYATTPAVPVLRMASSVNVINFSYSRPGVNTSPEDPTYENFYLGDTEPFYALFSNLPPPSSSATSTAAAAQLTLTDAVLQDYNTLKNSPRLSGADQQLLQQYVMGIDDLQAKIHAEQVAAASCSASNINALKGQLQTDVNNKVYYGFPGQDTSGDVTGITSCLKMLQNFNAIIQNAFLCDLTRVVTVANEIFQDAVLDGGTIQSEFHCHMAAQDQPMHAWFLNNVVASLASLLASTPDPLNLGTSLLDNTVIVFTNEHVGGNAEHAGRSLPFMTIGSAGGSLKTGYYFDCRQRPYTGDQYSYDLGRPCAQLLISIMQALGLQPSEYAVGGTGNPNGFGDFESAPEYQAFNSTHNSPLPFVNV
jgi:hypothetical protein